MLNPHRTNMTTFMGVFLEGVRGKGKTFQEFFSPSFSIGTIILYMDVLVFPFNAVELNNLVYSTKCVF